MFFASSVDEPKCVILCLSLSFSPYLLLYFLFSHRVHLLFPQLLFSSHSSAPLFHFLTKRSSTQLESGERQL